MKTWTDDATAHVKRYLRQVQVRLEESGADAHEVVEDLSRHIHQRANDSPLVVITLDEVNRILAAMGTPDEVALSWKQLGTDDKSQGWDSPALNPPPVTSNNAQRWLWAVLGIALTLLAMFVIVPWMVWSASTAPEQGSGAKTDSALIEAARNGHLETVRSLLDAGAPINAQDAQGMAALHHAAKNGHNGTVQLLIERGAKIDIRDRTGKTPADHASAGGHSATVAAILGKAEPQSAETPDRLRPAWFQAGNDHANYMTGTSTGINGISEAMFIRGDNASAPGFCTVMKETKADSYRGSHVKLTSNIKTEIAGGNAAMWLRIDAADGSVLGFDNMNDRPITGNTETKSYTIELDVPAAAASVAYGVLFQGQGTVWFGDIDFAVAGPMQSSPAVAVLQSAPASATLPPPWFQAGNDHANYKTGVLAVNGIPGNAMYIESTSANPSGFATIMTEQPAAQYRGRKITLTGKISSTLKSGWAGMWLRIDGSQGEALGFDNMQDRPISGTSGPASYSITLDVPETAAQLAYGVLFQGEGAVYFGDISLR